MTEEKMMVYSTFLQKNRTILCSGLDF